MKYLSTSAQDAPMNFSLTQYDVKKLISVLKGEEVPEWFKQTMIEELILSLKKTKDAMESEAFFLNMSVEELEGKNSD